MSIERNLILYILKLTTQNHTTTTKQLQNNIKLPPETIQTLLQKLQAEDLLSINNELVKVSTNDRLNLAAKSVTLGADIEHVSNTLKWQEFEEITAMALHHNNFTVYKNTRFKSSTRKWEIDIIGCKQPVVVCIDCKHWSHAISPLAIAKIATTQAERTKALTETLPNPKLQIECTKWNNAQFIPAILSLTQNSFKFYNNIPIVPILQLQDFLNQLPAHIHQLTTYQKTFTHIN
jgi:Mn-dependent DtxR family transcriptional regulator